MNAGTRFFGGHPVVSAIMLSRTSVSPRKLRTVRLQAVLGRLAMMTFLLAMTAAAFPLRANAAWVTSDGSQFQVGGKLAEIVPTLVSTAPGIANSPALVDPTCGNQAGRSPRIVRALQL